MILEKTTSKTALMHFKEYYKSLDGGIDGYYETLMIRSESYYVVDEENVAMISIGADHRLTCFYVFENYFDQYSDILCYVLSLPTIEKIIFSTKDERLTNEIKHLGLTVEYQAYNFVMKNEVTTNFKMKLATMDEYEVIHKTFTELPFMDYKIKIPNKEVYISYDEQGNLISIGILDPMLLPENRVCVGMEVVKSQRNNGYGTKTIEFLVQLLQQQQIGINARCYYYNHPSKKTLLKSGFEVSNLLLRVESLISIDSDSNSQADY